MTTDVFNKIILTFRAKPVYINHSKQIEAGRAACGSLVTLNNEERTNV
jgi:hypothetical protein